MKLLKTKLALFLSVAVTVSAFAENYWIEIKGKKQEVYNIDSMPNGDLKVTFKRGDLAITKVKSSYSKAGCDEPSDKIEGIEKYFDRGDYAKAAARAKPVYAKYKFLGHGSYPGYVIAQSLYKLGKVKEALAAFKDAAALPGDSKSLCEVGVAKCQFATGEVSKAEASYNKLLKAGGAAAAFVFNAQGKTALKKGDKSTALRSFMKTVTLFADADHTVKEFFEEAKAEAKKLLQEKGDSRAKQL